MENSQAAFFATLGKPLTPVAAEATAGADLWEYANKHRSRIETAIKHSLPLAPAAIQTTFNEAVFRAIFPGGKRLRPVITLLGAELYGADPAEVLPAAVAVEFIHTSSLIFDDLPSMDDSSERRGEIALHEAFGEGLATLVAIGFLNASYKLVTLNNAGDPERSLQAIGEAVECIGPSGMIGGQALDLLYAERPAGTARELAAGEHLKNLKTTSLIRLALKLGAIHAHVGSSELSSLDTFADLLGLAYQKSDDLIDLKDDAARIAAKDNLSLDLREKIIRRELDQTVTAAKELIRSDLPQCRASECLLQLSDYIRTRVS